MRRRPANHAAETHNRVETPGIRQAARRLRQLERAGNALDCDRVRRRAGLDERRPRAVAQARGNRFVEAGIDDGEAEAAGAGQRRRRCGLVVSHALSAP